MTPPEVLRFLIVKNQPNKHIVFDPGFGLLNLVDEYDQFERIFFGKEDIIKGMKDIEKIYELSQPYFQIKFHFKFHTDIWLLLSRYLKNGRILKKYY